jgi:hypothetical protein
MNKTIWYGAKDNNVRFANHQNSLVSQGINNPQSFTTAGDVSGLTFIDDDAGLSTGATAQGTQQQG